MRKLMLLSLILALFAAGSVQAAFITWEDPVFAYDASDETAWVSKEGDLVYAMNCIDPADSGITEGTTLSYGGVDWINTGAETLKGGATQGLITITGTPSGLGDTDGFQSGQFTNDPDSLYKGGYFRVLGLAISGLTDGQEYQLQIMGNDSDHSGGYFTVLGDGTQSVGDSITDGTAGILPTVMNPGGQGGVIIGSFTADATGIVSIDMYGSVGDWDDLNKDWASSMNALQIREVPEPATLLLLGLGGLVLRKRK